MAYFPLFVNLKNKEVLVIGGGEASFQEISRFLVFEANIVIMAGEISQPLQLLGEAYAKKIRIVQTPPTIEAIQQLEANPTLVVCTLNDVALNTAIYAYFKDRHVLVEDASSSARCDFIFPAIVKRGDVVCGISSSGKSPHVSQFIKSLLESNIPENISQINEHMNEIRKAVKQSISDPAKRTMALQAIFTRLIEDDNQTPDYEIDGIIGEIEEY